MDNYISRGTETFLAHPTYDALSDWAKCLKNPAKTPDGSQPTIGADIPAAHTQLMQSDVKDEAGSSSSQSGALHAGAAPL